MPNHSDTTETGSYTASLPTTCFEPSLTPVSAENRLDVMDILRGFALFGILLMNIEFFNIALTSLGQFDTSYQGLDWTAGWLIKVFIEGKFYKLFSLLFGMGFAVMLIRAQHAGRPFTGWFVRRMLVLFVIGMLHMCFLWGGDILHDYALGGLLLLGWVLLIRRPKMVRLAQTKWFLRIALGMMILPAVIALFAGLYIGATHDLNQLRQDWYQRQAVVAISDKKLQEAKQQETAMDNPVVGSHLLDQVNQGQNEPQPSEEHNEGGPSPVLPQQSTTDDDDTASGQQIQPVSDAETPLQEKNEEDMTAEELIEFEADERFNTKLENWREVELENKTFTRLDYWAATLYRSQKALEMLKYTPMFVLIMGFPLFMLGYWFVASGIINHIERHVVLFTTMTWVGLSFGLIMSVAGMLIDVHPAAKDAFEIRTAAQTLFFFGQMVLTAGYLGALVLLVHKQSTRRYLLWLAPMGRMALTNYIMHSVILTSVFYGYAGGLYGEVGRAWQVAIALGILFAQALISRWWLSYFRFGPLEWLWRCLTYMQLHKFRI
ncbi:DUF418 domain-containing protein [Neptunicella sp. SCSIO 80796]|uniref:DUF418 domain-containing protein n=1 Tax=Neptunicella plasticusilytica TaxID=3117012 RepID=UPI003A4E176D